MDLILTNEEIRVLGCLIEKKMATPEYYPLSMNALVNACNQKSNRDPVVAWEEDTVYDAIEALKEKQRVFQSNLSRVPKYEECFVDETDLIPSEAAILCILMLRGPQTAGEIRGRTERLCAFEDLESVNNTLENLISRDLVTRLARQPGRKEVRYCHMMAGDATEPDETDSNPDEIQQEVEGDERITELEEKVEYLSSELEALKQQFDSFRKQFE